MIENNEDLWIDELLSSEDLWTDELLSSLVETEPPVPSHNFNVPSMMSKTTSLSNKPLQVAVETSPILSQSQKSQHQREKRITWTVEEHRYYNIHIFIYTFIFAMILY